MRFAVSVAAQKSGMLYNNSLIVTADDDCGCKIKSLMYLFKYCPPSQDWELHSVICQPIDRELIEFSLN